MNIDWIEADILAASRCPYKIEDLTAIRAAGIKAVISLTETPVDILEPMIQAGDIEYLHAPIIDYQSPSNSITNMAIRFIERMKAQQSPVLIHCMAGVGRTGTILHAYYIAQGMSLDETKQFIQSHRATNSFDHLSQPQRRFLETFARNNA